MWYIAFVGCNVVLSGSRNIEARVNAAWAELIKEPESPVNPTEVERYRHLAIFLILP